MRRLTDEQVQEARTRATTGGASIRSLALAFGVHRKTMKNIVDGVTYKDVPIMYRTTKTGV